MDLFLLVLWVVEFGLTCGIECGNVRLGALLLGTMTQPFLSEIGPRTAYERSDGIFPVAALTLATRASNAPWTRRNHHTFFSGDAVM